MCMCDKNMIIFVLNLLFIIDVGYGQIWSKGVVHYAINTKDYDLHSQDIILSTFADIQKEICVKFFNTPLNYSASEQNKILYISNADKRKTCPPEQYDFNRSVVDMPIGYKCINKKDISKMVVEMLRASIEQTVFTINSYDLIKQFQAHDDDSSRPTLLSAKDRNYINAHYHAECGALTQHPAVESRRFSAGSVQMSPENEMYYKEKIWPLGIVMYGVEEKMKYSPHHNMLKYAMTTIELASCVVFQEVEDAILQPKNLLWFASEGEEMPALGFREGNQTVSIISMTSGASGHTGHTLNALLRALGVPMMSNRYDRDNYLHINWGNVQEGKEHYLEKTPEAACLTDREGGRAPYSFESVTHAPANYMCGRCSLTAHTVQPIQDHLWQRTLSMGHRSDLAPCDVDTLNVLYSKQCQNRIMTDRKQ